jgi:hypothetical protein
LPVHPHPNLVTRLSAEQQSCLTAHQARLPTPPPGDPPALEVTAETQRTLGRFALSMSFEERLHGLAVDGGPLLVADGFTANNSRGVSSYPKDVTPPGAIEVHMAAHQRKGRVIVLPLDFARTACETAGISFSCKLLLDWSEARRRPPSREADQRLLSPS